MSKEISLFNTDELTFKEKFYNLMDLLITNQSVSMMEAILFLSIFYLQYVSAFFDEKIEVFDGSSYFLDNILNHIKKIVRIKDLFSGQYNTFQILEIIFFVLIIICIIHFLCVCLTLKKDSIYDMNKQLINLYFKFFIYVFYNVFLDFCFSNFCMGSSKFNPNFTDGDVTCAISEHTGIFAISIILAVLCFFVYILIQTFFSDAFYLNGSYYAKMSSEYESYLAINSLIMSLLLNQVKFLSKEFFLVYNLIMSLLLFIYYCGHIIFYEDTINIVVGIFHLLYFWTSFFLFNIYFY